MSDELITVFGGSGFVGKQVVRALAKRGKRVRVAMRRPHLGHELRVMGDVGQIQLFQANVRYPDSLDRALEGATGAVNLVAVLLNKGTQNYENLHVDGARNVAEAAAKAGVSSFVHMSALGAAETGPRFARSRFAGEQAVREALPGATILRPSIVFGPEDDFFNRFGEMARLASHLPLGALPLIGAKTKFQPVFVGDVAEAVANALVRSDAQGKTYELGGPRTYTMRELLSYITAETERRVPLLPLPFFVAHPIGILSSWVLGPLPFVDPPITGDQVTMLKRDNIVGESALTLADLGVTTLESVEAIVPTYLWRFRPYGQFQTKQNPA